MRKINKINKMNKMQKQNYEYNNLINNYKKYKRQVILFDEKYTDDISNIYYINYSRFLQKKISRIEKML